MIFLGLLEQVIKVLLFFKSEIARIRFILLIY